jgi:hypothetical protein
MKKPKKVVKEILDYHDCVKYIEKKYKIDLRDFKGLFGKNYDKLLQQICTELGVNHKDLEEDLSKADNKDPEVIRKKSVRAKVYKQHEKLSPEYCDFWHFLIDNYGLQNGSDLSLSKEDISDTNPDWVNQIIKMFLDEFGEGEDQECEFNIFW